jgi:hypothetical protein
MASRIKSRSGILRRVALGALGATSLCFHMPQSAAQVTLDPIDVAAGKPRKKRETAEKHKGSEE